MSLKLTTAPPHSSYHPGDAAVSHYCHNQAAASILFSSLIADTTTPSLHYAKSDAPFLPFDFGPHLLSFWRMCSCHSILCLNSTSCVSWLFEAPSLPQWYLHLHSPFSLLPRNVIAVNTLDVRISTHLATFVSNRSSDSGGRMTMP